MFALVPQPHQTRKAVTDDPPTAATIEDSNVAPALTVQRTAQSTALAAQLLLPQPAQPATSSTDNTASTTAAPKDATVTARSAYD